MKSLNTKKIVAMATGAALLGSALLGAVSYQNTELINDNGAPMAKVVVGSNAHISDGVAAANIAAVLGNMAFKSVEVTATPTGINGLSCDVSGDSAGTCSVLSKSVDLEVVTPAGVIPAGAYGFSTLINDFIDSDLKDRDDTGDNEDFPTMGLEPSKRIRVGDFSALADYTVKDSQSSVSVVEKQNIYVKADLVDGVHYNVDDGFKVNDVAIAYEITFDNPGLPVCTDAKGDYWAHCKGLNGYDVDTDKQIENNRVKIKFLGEEWILSEMGIDGTNVDEHGFVKLAKESAYSPKLQIGEDLDLGDGNKLVLGDLKPASGDQKNDIAIFSVLNAAGEEIASKTVAAGATVEITAGSNIYRVRVYQVAPGYTLTEKWAEVAVFANELKLENNEGLENNEDDWDVTLVWRNEKTNSATGTDWVDTLSKIQLVRGSEDLLVGEYLTFVEDPAIWRFTFTGLNLAAKDYTGVTVNFENFPSSNRVYTDCTDDLEKDSCDEELTVVNKVIKVKSDSKNFIVTDVDSVENNKEVDTIYILPFGTNDTTNYGQMVVFNNGKSREFFIVDNSAMQYEIDGKKYNMGVYSLNTTGDWNLLDHEEETEITAGTISMLFEEDAEKSYNFLGFTTAENYKTSNDLVIDADGNDVASDGDDDEIAYHWDTSYTTAGLPSDGDYNNTDGWPTVEVDGKFYTARGSYVDYVRSSGVRFQFAHSVGELGFLLQSTGATESEAGAMTYSNLKEGDSIDVLGAKVKVKAIDVETGPCTSATGAGSVTGIEGIACTINANVANLGERQNIPTDLVIMDKAATNVETVIAVGGPMVNDVTAALFPAENPLQGAGDVYIAEVAAGKIVVAGYTADDTMDAAMNFIATLRGQ